MDEHPIYGIFQNEEGLSRAQRVMDSYLGLSGALGELAMHWAAVDTTIDALFEPLLDCSEAQVACILVENISARCEMVKKLLHVEPLPDRWTAWVEALLSRASGELASKRNRYLHDAWRITVSETSRTDKRAILNKPQARQKRQLRYKTKYATSIEEIRRLAEQVLTVSIALRVAEKSLRLWRSEGRRPRLAQQWLPASKPGARMTNFLADPAAFERPLAPLNFAFD